MLSSTIKELTLHYDPVNETNTFTNGDVLQGRVFLEVSKEANINSFYVKCKGDANVKWSERRNDRTYWYSSHERYFKLKQIFIRDPSKPEKLKPNVIITSGETYSNVIRPGRHVYPFSFQLPHGNMPPSFKGYYGSVKYTLEVSLDRSWKLDKTSVTEINFVPKIASSPQLMSPQNGAVDKKMKLFTSGSASLSATIDKMAYIRGDAIRVSTNVDNSSSRELKLKYSLEQKQAFYAQGRSKHSLKTIFKVVGDPIQKGSKATVNTNLVIPSNVELTVGNCSIIKQEYILTVYLDVPYAGDPEIKFPVIIFSGGQFCTPWQSQPSFQPYGPNPPPQASFGPSPPGAGYGPSPPGAGYGPSPPGAGYGPSPPGAGYGPSPPGAGYGPSPPGAGYGPSPPGAGYGPSPPGAGYGPSPPGAGYGPSPPGVASGPVPPVYPSQPANPSAPPPSYSDVYPNQNLAVPGFQPTPSAPSAPPLNPPPYSALSFPSPSAPPTAPSFHPNPTAPAYGQAAGAPGFWPNSANPATQPQPYPTKPPEKPK